MRIDRLDVEKIERDLGTLAKHKAGFENPQSLANELELLLDLQCVTEAAHPNEESKVARVLALREVLAAVIDRLPNPETKREALIYFFLEGPFTQSTLTERRAEISGILGVRGDKYRFGPEQRLRGIVAGELMRFELEALGGAPPPQPTEITQVSTPRQGTVRNIATAAAVEYRPGEDLAPLVSLILPERPAFYDVMVDLTLADVPAAADHYRYDLSLTFSADLNEYVVALVDRPGLCDLLLGDCPTLTDAYSCSGPSSRKKRAEALRESIDAVTLIEKTAAGTTRERPLRLSEVEPGDYGTYLEHLAEEHSGNVSLFRAEIPQATTVHSRLRVRQQLDLEKADHFCYWVADRPTYVRRIDVDYGQFSPPGENRSHSLTVQPFLMTGAAQGVLGATPHVTLPIENWLVRGQGIAIVW